MFYFGKIYVLDSLTKYKITAKIYLFSSIVDCMCLKLYANIVLLTLILTGEVLRGLVYIFHRKSLHFAVNFIQSYTKLTPCQNLGHYFQTPPEYLAFSKI